MMPTGTFSSLTSASPVVEVRDHHQEVRLGMPVNLVQTQTRLPVSVNFRVSVSVPVSV